MPPQLGPAQAVLALVDGHPDDPIAGVVLVGEGFLTLKQLQHHVLYRVVRVIGAAVVVQGDAVYRVLIPLGQGDKLRLCHGMSHALFSWKAFTKNTPGGAVLSQSGKFF